ncbi:hypothetical protein [Flagellimonas allohymeniacidonis]|uniref:Uncharacterized protein n=1 Tax=Flagellimonas allohymeniacidonis TaxID=2517819 RepID=A0A4Q8QJY3_9FLAO|nr:hypothetical protein [Allomuricauda hymeniacidonis]TAI48809.1 hypothetical protein EW142_03150 [Allomuricauda hymeniacidonis]
MKKNKALTLIVFIFLACASHQQLKAQEDTYIHVEYIKLPTNAWNDYWTQMQEVWKPTYEAMIQKGELKSWKLFWVRFPAGQEIPYDIVNVTFHKDSVGMSNNKVSSFFTSKQEGSTPYAEATINLMNITNTVKTETYQVVEEAHGSFELDSLAKTNQNYQIDFMDSAQEKADAYVRMEAEVFKPMHQVALNDGRLKSWVLCRRTSQDDDAILQRFMIFNQWSSWANWQSAGGLQDFQKVNPSLDQEGFNDIFRRIGHLRQMTKSEMWTIWDEL